MARTDSEVVDELREIYREEFGGAERQRFLISWADIRDLYGFSKLFGSRFALLVEAAAAEGLYLWNLPEGENGHFVAVVAIRTVDRWRRVPRRIITARREPIADVGDEAATAINGHAATVTPPDRSGGVMLRRCRDPVREHLEPHFPARKPWG